MVYIFLDYLIGHIKNIDIFIKNNMKKCVKYFYSIIFKKQHFNTYLLIKKLRWFVLLNNFYILKYITMLEFDMKR